jgi:exodeoxyribonuclease VII large subunit
MFTKMFPESAQSAARYAIRKKLANLGAADAVRSARVPPNVRRAIIETGRKMSLAPNITSGQMKLSLEPERRVFRVNELNAEIQRRFEAHFHSIDVAGEISGCRLAASGHYYFSLKDESSQVKCALFKGAARFARFKPQDGLAVIAHGNLEVYEARGEYQLIVERLEPQGAGALQLAFEQLKRKLGGEGLFEAARKRALPKLPFRIGIVSSPSGAVIRDMLHVLERRFRGFHVRLFPASVQGEASVEQVCAGLQFFSESGWPEVIIVARGGGSIEDLWTFNEEAVARAIAASRIPVISAVGHETDFTIADFVADYRAPTPSAAAEIVICTSDSLLEQIAGCRNKAVQAIRYRLLMASRDIHRSGSERTIALMHRRLTTLAQTLDELDERLKAAQRISIEHRSKRWSDLARRLDATDLRVRFSRNRHRSDLLTQRLIRLAETTLWKVKTKQESLTLHLSQLSPLAVLARGYSIVEKSDARIVRNAEDVAENDRLRVRLHHGELAVKVQTATPEA